MACEHVWWDSGYKYTTHGSCNRYLKVKTQKSPGGVEENGQARHLPESALQEAQQDQIVNHNIVLYLWGWERVLLPFCSGLH